MSFKFNLYSIFFFSTMLLTACAESRIFGDDGFDKPTNIKIEGALESIAKGFVAMMRELGSEKTGFFPCKSTITMNVTAAGESNDSLVLNASARPAPGLEKILVTGDVSGKGEFVTGFTANRANTITFDMYNVACIPQGTLGFDKPDKVALVAVAIADLIQRIPIDKRMELTPEQKKLLESLPPLKLEIVPVPQ